MENKVNLWVRADIERSDPETKQLIQAGEQVEYEAVLDEVAEAGLALNSLLGLIPQAQERMKLARAAQLAFFANQQVKGTV